MNTVIVFKVNPVTGKFLFLIYIYKCMDYLRFTLYSTFGTTLDGYTNFYNIKHSSKWRFTSFEKTIQRIFILAWELITFINDWYIISYTLFKCIIYYPKNKLLINVSTLAHCIYITNNNLNAIVLHYESDISVLDYLWQNCLRHHIHML